MVDQKSPTKYPHLTGTNAKQRIAWDTTRLKQQLMAQKVGVEGSLKSTNTRREGWDNYLDKNQQLPNDKAFHYYCKQSCSSFLEESILTSLNSQNDDGKKQRFNFQQYNEPASPQTTPKVG